MSSDLALTGLASGFDWKPVVDQLMELEAIPKRRLEREKIKNDEKMSELGLLKGQLDTLKGVSSALQNDDLFEARKVAIDENSAKVLYATADPGTMTGTYKVEVISLASSTAMTSILRKPKGLGAALHKSAANPNAPLVAFGQPLANDIALQDLPLQTQITKGTFTIEGKTFEIHDLSMGLKELMDTLNLDPEFDGKNVQLEYEEDPTRSGYDKIIIDSNISSAGGNPYIPTMGSPTDTSNFLQVMRLLNRQPDTPRPSDFEAGTAIGDWDALTTAAQTWADIKALNPVTDAKWMSWISQADLLYPSPSPTDDRIFMGYDPDGAGPNKTLMYRRKDPAVAGIAQFTNHPNQPGSETAWAAAGEKVYSDGYLWKTLSGLPTAPHDPGVSAAPTATKYRIAGGPEKGFYELAATFEGGGGLNVDAAAGQNFSTALAAGNHKPNTGGEYKKGDVVRAGDNSTSYFRAIRDRNDKADDLKNMAVGKGFADLKADDAAKAVSTWIKTDETVGGDPVFRPEIIQVDGRLYKARTDPEGDGKVAVGVGQDYFGSNNGFIEHGGSGDAIIYSDKDLVVGKAGPGTVEQQAFRANGPSIWDDLALPANKHDGSTPGAPEQQSSWTPHTIVQNADDNKFYSSNAAWTGVRDMEGMTTFPKFVKDDYVWERKGASTASTQFFWKANGAGKWDDVETHTGVATVDSPVMAKDTIVWRNMGGNKGFYQAKDDFKLIATKVPQKIYAANGDVVNNLVKDVQGAVIKFYEAKDTAATWDAITSHTQASRPNTVSEDDVVQLSGGAADKNFYQAEDDLKNIVAHDKTTIYKQVSGTLAEKVVEDGANPGKYYQAKLDTAEASYVSTGAKLTAGEIGNIATNDRVLDGALGGVAWKAKENLSSIATHSAGTSYKTGAALALRAVKEGSGDFWEFTHGDGFIAHKEANFSGAGLTWAAQINAMNAGDRSLDTSGGGVFTAKALLDTIADQNKATNYLQDSLIQAGERYFKAKLAKLAKDTFNGSMNDLTATGKNVAAGEVFLDTGGEKAYKAVLNLKDVGNHQAEPASDYDPSSGTLDNKLRKVGNGAVAKYYKPQKKIDLDTNFLTTTPYAASGTDFTIAKSGGQYYQFDQAYLGEVAGGANATGNLNEWVKVQGGNYYRAKINGANSDPALTPAEWADSGQNNLAALNTAGEMVTDVTSFVTDPAAVGNTLWSEATSKIEDPSSAANPYWTLESDATTPASNQPGNIYWQEITNDVKKPGATNDYWTKELDATTLDNNAFWTKITDEIRQPTTANQAALTAAAGRAAYWEDVSATLNLTDGTYWGEVTNEVTLANQTGGDTTSPVDGTTKFWQDVTDEIVDFTKVGTGGQIADDFWTDVTNEISLSAPGTGAGTSEDYWLDVTDELTNPDSAGNAVGTFASWWTDATDELTKPGTANFANWWLDVTPALTDFSLHDATTKNVTGATNAGGPIKITSTGHGLSNNEVVKISGVTGNTDANGIFKVTKVDNNEFTLNDTDGAAAGAYVNGGTWTRLAAEAWTDVTADVSDPTASPVEFDKYWTEYGQANDWVDYDPNYWQKVKPGMRRHFTGNSRAVPGLFPRSVTPNPADAHPVNIGYGMASHTGPIVITSKGHGLNDGDQVLVADVTGNTNANNTWKVANKTTDTFELAGSTGNGPSVGGTWKPVLDKLDKKDYWNEVNTGLDLSIWKRIGNLRSFRGEQATNEGSDYRKTGTHDADEHPLRPLGGIQAWTAATEYYFGDVVEKNGKYYRSRDRGKADEVHANNSWDIQDGGNVNIAKDPEADAWPTSAPKSTHPGKLTDWFTNPTDPGETDYQPWPGAAYWDLLYDPADHNGVAAVENDVYKMAYVDTDYWEQMAIPAPTTTSIAGNPSDPYWEVVQETTISSSQKLGAVNLQKVIKDANFADFDDRRFTMHGNTQHPTNNIYEKGVFFVGEGAGAVRIEYDIENDTVADLIERVNTSDANVTMFYDPVGDRFVLQNDAAGSVGLTVHESPADDPDNPSPLGSTDISRRPYGWDKLSANSGKGNILELMGLAAESWGGKYDTGGAASQTYKALDTPGNPTGVYPEFSSAVTYETGDYVRIKFSAAPVRWAYWQAKEAVSTPVAWSNSAAYNINDTIEFGSLYYQATGNITAPGPNQDPTVDTANWKAFALEPSVDNNKWTQVIPGVGRAQPEELGGNAKIRINDGLGEVYANKPVFDADTHGYKGLLIDVSRASAGDVGTFKIQRDVEPAKGAIGKFVEEFNDAQDYVRSLVAVNNDGDKVTAGTFSSNIEISRLGSQLRKIVFGDSYAHSQSAITNDGANITLDVNTNDPTLNGNNSDVEQLGTDLGAALVTDYVVKVNADDSDNDPNTLNPVAYYRWDGAKWVTHKPRFSAFRLADIGLDFGTGSDRLQVKNASKLAEQLLENPDKVKALFGETPVEATKTAEAADEAVGAVTLNNKDPNNPTTTLASAAASDLIANPLSKDNNTNLYRSYQGITHALNDFLGNFLTGDEDSSYKGAYKAHIDSLRSQNKRIDDRIEDMNRFLEQRENALSQSFIRMEEMQSKLNTQMQTLTNSFASSKK